LRSIGVSLSENMGYAPQRNFATIDDKRVFYSNTWQ